MLSGEARADAEILLAHVLGCSRAAVIAGTHAPPDAAARAAYEALLARRARGEPVAYLTGRREFWSLSLEVTPDVLIPRPETELLVEWALSSLPASSRTRVLDLGTGSGALALALASERPAVRIVASDVSAAALAVARRNAVRLGLAGVAFVESDGFDGIEGTFDVIVSNPPYVAEHDPHLAELRFEPTLALVSGADGLAAIRRIVAGAPRHLAPAGWLLLEHGAAQGEAVRALLRDAGFTAIETRRDLAGHERATGARAPA